ncbi:recombinase family protein [Paenisporosarcina indica]|uniref:recombinase family protein n=1 Tax=Paenisporosarcina indica TaxID=650093 RepID=UPI00094FBE86|nr:recombinase family protein [Paenisporosarcina indica]
MPTTFFLGYDTTEDGGIVVDDEQAEVGRRIFREILGGNGCPSIAKDLMRDGLKTGKGNTTLDRRSFIGMIYKSRNNHVHEGHSPNKLWDTIINRPYNS